MGSFLFATLFADTLFADTLVVPFPSDAKIQNNILVPDGGNNPWYSKS